MELITLWMGIGFLFAAYSVIANDSVQTSVHGLHQIMRDLLGRRCGLQHRLFYFGLYGMAGICTEVIFRMVDLIKYHFKRYNGTTQWRQDCCYY